MSKSNVVINEGQVIFKRVEGHKHDGLTSSLIDTSKYSMFDFVASENSRDQRRNLLQQNNKNVLKTFIIDTIEGRVLNPEGIRIQANAVTAREIVSGTITADELAANIILVNNSIRSTNYISNSTTKTGWIISNTGNAEFNDVTVRGNLLSGNGNFNNADTPLFASKDGNFSLGNKFVWTASSNSVAINAASLTLGSNLSWNGSTLTITGSLHFPDGSTPGTFDNGDSLTDGFIGGIDIFSTGIQSTNFVSGSAGFRITSGGNAEFNNVTVRGTIVSGSGSIGGLTINPSHIDAGSIRITSDGFLQETNGGGVRIRNADGVTTGTQLFGNVIFAPRMEPAFFNCYDGTNSTVINNNGTVVVTSSSPSAGNLDLSRNYGAGENFIRFVNRTSGTAITAIEFISTTRADFNHNSDVRLKEDISNMTNGLNIINGIRPVNYRMKSGLPDEYEDGFIAQELYEVYPAAVSCGLDDVDENGNLIKPWGIYYGTFAPLLTLAIQELSAKVVLLESRIQAIEGV